jgi:hypothetical protein
MIKEKKKKNIGTLIALFALIVSAISLLISVRSCRVKERVKHLHIIPQIEVFYLQSKRYDRVVFRNTSPIEIVSLSINYKTYGFDKEKDKYRVVATNGGQSIIDDSGQNWIFRSKLSPNEIISEFIGDLSSGSEVIQDKLVVVRVFDLTYYRHSDMSKFGKRIVFFIDNGKVYTYNEARKIEALRNPIEQLDAFIQKYLNKSPLLGDVKIKKNN